MYFNLKRFLNNDKTRFKCELKVKDCPPLILDVSVRNYTEEFRSKLRQCSKKSTASNKFLFQIVGLDDAKGLTLNDDFLSQGYEERILKGISCFIKDFTTSFKNEFYIENEEGAVEKDKMEYKITINNFKGSYFINDFLDSIQIIRVYKENLVKDSKFFEKFRKEFLNNKENNKRYFIFLGDFAITKNINELEGSINILKARGLDGNNANHFINISEYNKDNEICKEERNLRVSIVKENRKKIQIEIKKCVDFFYILERYNYSRLYIAQEFHDFHYMKLQNSSISIPGGHSESVLSFSFHSESKALENANKSILKIIKYLNVYQPLQRQTTEEEYFLYYKVLLVDDYIQNKLRSEDEDEFSKLQYILLFLCASILRLNDNNSFTKDGSYRISLNNDTHEFFYEFNTLSEDDFKDKLKKCTSDKTVLKIEKQIFDIEDNENKWKGIINIEFHTKTNVEETLKSNKAYDLILLDYLFNGKVAKEKDDFKNLSRGKLHYGISFLEKIAHDRGNVDLLQSPLNNYWVLPISTFSHAMIDEMQNMGISFVSKDYYLSRGADPINTPYLFLSKFLQIIEKQLDFSLEGLYEFNSKWKEQINDNLQNLINQTIDIDKERDIWIEEMDKVAEVFSNMQKLRKDEKNGSLFAKSINIVFREDSLKQKLRILSHYRELMYHLSFHSLQNNENVIIETQKLLYLMNRYQS